MRATVLDATMRAVFGSDDDPMTEVEARARRAYPGQSIIVWEGDAQTFAFGYVGGDAERLLGHPSRCWSEQADFWTAHVVHPEDRDDAVAFCALATGKGADHVFEYRALTTDGEIRWLEDYVRVIFGRKHIPVRLRGLMFDVTAQKTQLRRHLERPSMYRPSLEELRAR